MVGDQASLTPDPDPVQVDTDQHSAAHRRGMQRVVIAADRQAAPVSLDTCDGNKPSAWRPYPQVVAHAEDLLLRKFAHFNPRLRRPKNVSHLIDAARRPAVDQVAHLWIADPRAESTGKVRPHDGERTLP